MARPISKNQMADLWMAEFLSAQGYCCLCGNDGVIDTRGKLKTRTGIDCGARVYCICPNGRKMKKLKVNIDTKG